MQIYKFNANSHCAPAYTCSQPGDNSGYYVQKADFDRQCKIASKYKDRYFAARELLSAIVDQYDAAPDGPLGKGFTNGPFLEAKAFIRGA